MIACHYIWMIKPTTLQYDIVPGDTENSLIEDVLPDGLNNVKTFHEAEWRIIRRLLLMEQKVF